MLLESVSSKLINKSELDAQSFSDLILSLIFVDATWFPWTHFYLWKSICNFNKNKQVLLMVLSVYPRRYMYLYLNSYFTTERYYMYCKHEDVTYKMLTVTTHKTVLGWLLKMPFNALKLGFGFVLIFCFIFK